MSVSDWMTPDPLTIGPHTQLREALSRMVRHRVKHLPVVEAGRLLGMLSGLEVLQAVLEEQREGGELLSIGKRPAQDFVRPLEPLAPSSGDAETVERFSSEATCLPVVSDGRLVGVVSEGDLLRIVFDQMTPGQVRRRPLRPSRARTDVLLELMRQTATTEDLTELLTVVARHAETVMAVPRSGILLVRGHASPLLGELALGVDPSREFTDVPARGTLAGWVISHRTSRKVDDFELEQLFEESQRRWKGRLRSAIAAPLLEGGKCVGAVVFWADQAGAYLESDLELLELIANHIAWAVASNRRLEREQQLVRRLQKADQIKDEFLAVVTHDLGNALQGMLAYIHLLKRLEASPKAAKLTARLQESTRYMADLTRDLHDFARLGLDAIRLSLGEVDLPEAVARVFEESQEPAAQASIQLEASHENSSLGIVADPLRLRQILSNLISNAIKYNRPGGWVKLRTRQQGDSAVIEVEDSGIGIAPADQRRVFDLFAQVAGVRKVEGSGLGLSITQRLVEMHRGRIELESALGKGSLFRVLLPLR